MTDTVRYRRSLHPSREDYTKLNLIFLLGRQHMTIAAFIDSRE